jgi:hypothetical protein
MGSLLPLEELSLPTLKRRSVKRFAGFFLLHLQQLASLGVARRGLAEFAGRHAGQRH